jgi:hypothetical protein
MTEISITNQCDYSVEISTGVAKGARGSWGGPVYWTLGPNMTITIPSKRDFSRTILFERLNPRAQISYQCFSGTLVIKQQGLGNGYGMVFRAWTSN